MCIQIKSQNLKFPKFKICERNLKMLISFDIRFPSNNNPTFHRIKSVIYLCQNFCSLQIHILAVGPLAYPIKKNCVIQCCPPSHSEHSIQGD